jgi:hypothetical protein
MVEPLQGANAPSTSSIGTFSHKALDAWMGMQGAAFDMTPLCLLKFVQKTNHPSLEEAVRHALSKEPSEPAKQIYKDVGR